MKLPTNIKGRNKIRDAAIVLEFKRSRKTFEELSKMFKLTEMRISQILRTNHAFIKNDKEWEKEKRIARLERWLNDQKNKDTRKDPIEIQEALRKEFEGDDRSSTVGETKIIIIRASENNSNGRVEVNPQSISRSISI